MESSESTLNKKNTNFSLDYMKSLVTSKKDTKDFLVENWYPILNNVTAETIFIDISKEEAKVIIDFYNYRYHKQKSMTKEKVKTLKNFEEKIDCVIKENNFNETGFFAKLSFRSPKDGFPFHNEKIKDYFDEEVLKLKSKWNPEKWSVKLSKEDLEGNINWIAYTRAIERLMNNKSGKEVLSLLLSSERVKQDLTYALEYDDLDKYDNNNENDDKEIKKEYDWNMKLILRKWVEGVNGLMEFRCFVKNNKMNAITQYNHPFLIEELLSDEICLEIKEKVYEYWNTKVRKILEYLSDYVIDFAILENGEIFLVELNPFGESAGTGMFNWKDDSNILFGNNYDETKSELSNIVFRVRRDDEIPYGSHWEGFMSYMMIDMMEAKPYTEILEQI
jgi:hypothetical protein